jgi:hypothetical protein
MPSGQLRAPAIFLEVSLLTIFLWAHSEALVFVAWSVVFVLNALANYFCEVLDLNLSRLILKWLKYSRNMLLW